MSGVSVLWFGLMTPRIYPELDTELRANVARLVKESNERTAARSPQ